MASVLDLVRHYQHNLEKYRHDEQKVLRSIDKLFRLDVKVQHLQETGVGRTVNALRKEPGNVGQAARALVYKWKTMVAAEESDQEDDYRSEAVIHNGHGNDRDSDDYPPRSRQNQYEKSNETPKSETRDHYHMNGESSGSKRRHNSEENEPEAKKYKHYSSSENEDIKREHQIKIKREPSDSENHNSDSQSYESESDGSDSECEEKVTKIKTEAVDKYSSPSKLSLEKHGDSRNESSSSKKSLNSSEKHSRHSQSQHSHEKSLTKDKSHTVHKDKGSKEKEHKSETKHKSEHKSSDKDKTKDESKSTSKHSSSDKHRSSSHKSESGSDKHKSKSDKEKSASHSEKDKHKSSSEKEISHDKHKAKDNSHSSSSKDKSSSSKLKSKDDVKSKEGSSSSKEKSSSSKSDKKHSSSSDSKSKSSESKSVTEKGSERCDDKKSSHKSHSSTSSHKNSKSKEIPKKKEKAQNSEASDEDGIDCGSGASFAEALGMATPSKTKKKSTPIKDAFSPNGSNITDLSPAALLAPTTKLAPLPALEISALPDISPNYRPRPPPKFLPHFDEDAMSAVISSKNQRTKVYSGNKVIGKVPTLYELCVNILQEHIDALEYTGGVPYEILKPVVDKATPQQLFVLEHYNPYLMEDTDQLWQKHCEKHFRNKNRQEMETWREMYMRCQEEQEMKLKSLTANIKMTQEAKKAPIKQTKMAYVDSVVKPPRNIARKQAVHGTAHAAAASPAARVAALAAAPNVLRGGARPSPAPVITGASGASAAGGSFKPKKAPLMQKALQFMRGRKR